MWGGVWNFILVSEIKIYIYINIFGITFYNFGSVVLVLYSTIEIHHHGNNNNDNDHIIQMQGEGEFNNHWLFFTKIEIFTGERMFHVYFLFAKERRFISSLPFTNHLCLDRDNPGDGIVVSDTYKEVLISMIIAGVATSIKRTILALYL